MQCNQAFCGNAFTSGPFCSSIPLNATQNMYPEIVGEGQVTSVMLPDGTVQFFFIPTLKWWSPNASQCYPYPTIPNPMFASSNYNPQPCHNNLGTWFIRSVSNSCPQSVYYPQSYRNELLSLASNMDCNHKLNSHDFAYQVKFHNDGWTSTTDLVYFYPNLRQRDFMFTPPYKEETVQIHTKPVATNTVCDQMRNEVVCTKPCNCSIGAKPMSLECLLDPNLIPKSNNTSTDDICCSKTLNKRGMVHKKKLNKSKNIICACGPAVSLSCVDKSITTYADEGSGCTPADGRETQTCISEESKSVEAKPKKKSLLKQSLLKPKLTTNIYSDCSNADANKALNKRDEKKRYSRSRPKKGNCCINSSVQSVCSTSEEDTVASEDTPCTCSTCSSTTMLKKSKSRSRGAEQRTSSEQNTSYLHWFKSDNCVCEKCEKT